MSLANIKGKRPTRILLLNQFFWPDGAPTGVLLEDVARELHARGWDVTVLSSRSSYAGRRNDNPPPVQMLHTPTLPYSRGRVARLLSWTSFLMLATCRTAFLRHFDLIVTLTSPPGLSAIGLFLKVLRKSRFYIWEMDLYPDVATAVGTFKRGALAEKLVRAAFNRVRREADGIITIGECMRTLLIAQGLDPRRLFVAENWANSELIKPLEFPRMPPMVTLYSGNLGLVHDTTTISAVMLKLRDENDIKFFFAGGGAQRNTVETFCRSNAILNATFSSYVDSNALSERLASCHVGVVTLRSECLGTVVPSKIYSFLAAGRPILYIGPKTPMITRLIAQGCGWAFEPGDIDGVVRCLRSLVNDPASVVSAGARAHELFETSYDQRHGPQRIMHLLQHIIRDR